MHTTLTDGYATTARFYDDVQIYRDRPDVSFYVAEAVAAGGPVLELGCGTGRVLLPAARRGIDVTGLDASVSMLDQCRHFLSQESEDVRGRVRLVEGDMRRFDLGATFRLITIPFRPFQHLLDVEDQTACLASVRRHLPSDGRLVFDVYNPSLQALTQDDLGVEIFNEPEFKTDTCARVLRGYRTLVRDLVRQVNEIELIYRVTDIDGHTETTIHAFSMRYFFRYEVEHLLARCGFAVQNVYGGFDRSPVGFASPGELIFVAAPI